MLYEVITDKACGHLACKNHDGNGIAMGGCQSCYGICCTRTRGYKCDTRGLMHPCIGIGHVNSPLFVAHKNMAQVVVSKNFIMDINGGTAGISENSVV